MSQKATYQQFYRELFDLIMSGKAFSLEADEIRQKMDDMPGEGKTTDNWNAQKTQWGCEVGGPLYERKLYGRRLS